MRISGEMNNSTTLVLYYHKVWKAIWYLGS